MVSELYGIPYYYRQIMTIRKHGNNWYIDLYVNTAHGKRRMVKKAGPQKKHALILEEQIRIKNLKGEFEGMESNITIETCFKKYIQYSRDSKKRKKLVHLRDIKSLILEEFKSEILAKGKSPVTFNRYLELLKASLNKAVEWEFLAQNRLKAFKLLKPLNIKQIDFFTKDEIKKILESSDTFMKNCISIFLYTGLRLGELVNLTWGDIDFDNKLVHIQSKGKFTPKTKKARSIPMTLKLQEILSFIRDGSSVNAPIKPQSYIFQNNSGSPIKGQVLYDRFVQILRQTGLSGNIHKLRHTFASHLVISGVPLKAVQELLGHSNIQTTMRYSHLSRTILREAVSQLRF